MYVCDRTVFKKGGGVVNTTLGITCASGAEPGGRTVKEHTVDARELATPHLCLQKTDNTLQYVHLVGEATA